MHGTMALFAVDGKEKERIRRRVIEGLVQEEKIRAELADHQSFAPDSQMHFHVGRVSASIVRGENGR
jgi:hypothetical protein